MLKNKSSREKQTVSLLDFVCLFESSRRMPATFGRCG